MADRPTDSCKGLLESKEIGQPMVDLLIVLCYV